MSAGPGGTATRDRIAIDVVRGLDALIGRLRGAGIDPGAPLPTGPDDLETARGVVERGIDGVLDRLAHASEQERAVLGPLVVALHDARRTIRSHHALLRSHPAKAIDESVTRLRNVPTTAGLLDRVCAEAAHASGLSRVALATATQDGWSVCRLHDERDPDAPAPAKPPVMSWDGTREGTILRTGEGLAGEASDGPMGASPPMPFGGSYVAVPVPVSTGTAGLLLGDHHPTDRVVDELDRDLLRAFAGAFGQIYERTALQERLDGQRRTLVALLESESRAADELGNAGFALAGDPGHDPGADVHVAGGAGANADLDALLTPREREVLELILAGASNGAIAERLVITTGTVKSHVKRVLRKLGAANRSEAISRYLELGGDGR